MLGLKPEIKMLKYNRITERSPRHHSIHQKTGPWPCGERSWVSRVCFPFLASPQECSTATWLPHRRGASGSAGDLALWPKCKDTNILFLRVEVGKETGDMEHSRVLEIVAQNERGRISSKR